MVSPQQEILAAPTSRQLLCSSLLCQTRSHPLLAKSERQRALGIALSAWNSILEGTKGVRVELRGFSRLSHCSHRI